MFESEQRLEVGDAVQVFPAEIQSDDFVPSRRRVQVLHIVTESLHSMSSGC